MRRAQLSLMIIIGLVVIIMVAIGYYVISADKESRSGDELQRTQLAPELVRPIEQFTDGCFRVAVTDALRLLGKQGGVLYTSQGGLVDDSALVEGKEVLTVDGKRVWFGLQRPEGQVGDLYFATPPIYPWETFPLLAIEKEGGVSRIEEFHGFFGFERLPSLNGTIPGPALPSIEENLAAAIAHNVAACLDWEKLNLPVKVTSGEPQVDVRINSDDTTFILNASISVESSAGRGNLKLSTLRTAVRLARVYDAAKLVLGLDGNDISMDANSIDTGVISHSTVSIPGTADDVIMFVDNAGKLDGNPYEFMTARHDRAPALAVIESPGDSINLCQGATIRRAGDHLMFNAAVCDDDGKSGRVPRESERYPGFRCWHPGEKPIAIKAILDQGPATQEEIADGASYVVDELDARAGVLRVRVSCVEIDNEQSADWQDIFINVTARPKPQ
jgi:hypothetical protein